MEQSIKCPNCRATINWNDDEHNVVCPYCGEGFTVEEEQEPIDQNKQVLRVVLIVGCIIAAVVTGILISVFSFISSVVKDMESDPESTTYDYDMSEEDLDPFEDMTVTFTGVSGSGYADVEGSSSVYYTVNKNHTLHNGDVITIEAESYLYNLTRTECNVTVEGLEEYLVDPNTINDATLETLYKFSAKTIRQYINGGTGSSKVTIDGRVAIIALSGNDTNYVFDCYKATLTSVTGKSYDIYVTSKYTDLITRNDNASIDYNGVRCDGPYLSTHDVGEEYKDSNKNCTVYGYWSYDDMVDEITLKQEQKMTVKERLF